MTYCSPQPRLETWRHRLVLSAPHISSEDKSRSKSGRPVCQMFTSWNPSLGALASCEIWACQTVGWHTIEPTRIAHFFTQKQIRLEHINGKCYWGHIWAMRMKSRRVQFSSIGRSTLSALEHTWRQFKLRAKIQFLEAELSGPGKWTWEHFGGWELSGGGGAAARTGLNKDCSYKLRS